MITFQDKQIKIPTLFLTQTLKDRRVWINTLKIIVRKWVTMGTGVCTQQIFSSWFKIILKPLKIQIN